jgi:phage terminase large subunit
MPFESKVRRVGRPKGLTLSQDFGAACREALAGLSEISFPCTQYADDILGFARDVLGFTPCFTLDELVRIRDEEDALNVPEHERRPCLWPKQVEIMLAIQDAVHGVEGIKRVAVSSGHKISKSHTAAIVGAWFYSSFADAKVIFSSTTYHQVQTILWDEFRKTRYRSKVVIPGDMHQLASSGFVSEDFRSARGFTAREPEAVAGISGKNLLFILDEASGIPDDIHEAVKGNMAGGAAALMFSNPTRTSGTFFEAFNGKQDFYTTFQVSSEETPNAVTGRRLIPGLATKEFVEEMKAEWGEDSPFYKIRVKGLFVLADESKPFSLATLTAAELAWHETPAEGRLHIGVDPAGAGDGGDETAFCVRRGRKVVELFARQSLTEDGILTEILGLLAKHQGEREVTEQHMPVVSFDREGPIGYRAWLRTKTHFETTPDAKPCRVVGIRASDAAYRRPDLYDRVRDELWANLEAWFKQSGGTVPQDTKLERELNTIEWSTNLRGKLKATPKDDIRTLLNGRSPDRADALALAVWEPSGARASDADRRPPAPPPRPTNTRAGAFDPYAGSAFDPYSNL